MRRLFHVDPAEFYSLLSTLFPHIFVIGGRGDIRIEVRRYETLSDMLENGRGLEDLFCTFDPKPVAHLMRGRWRCNLREKALSVLKSGQKLFGPGQDNVIVISPSHRITSDVPRVAQESPGSFLLQLSLVQEGIAWFCELDDRLSLYLPACVA